MSLKVFPIPSLRDNYIWCIVDGNYITVVDPGEAKPVIDYIKKSSLELSNILITHHHLDHTAGVEEIFQKFPKTKIFGPENLPFDFKYNNVSNEDYFETQGPLAKWRSIACPGHTLDHICYYTQGYLFCGDVLFSAGCGRVFEGNAEQMYSSLMSIMSLPDPTLIFPGHEYTLANLNFAHYIEPNNEEITKHMQKVSALRQDNKPSLPSSILLEKKINPFLRINHPELSKSVLDNFGLIFQSPLELFTNLRIMKDRYN